MAFMAFSSSLNVYTLIRPWLFLCMLFGATFAQLSDTFYSASCPKALSIIESEVKSAISKEARIGASLLRLHFHDCFAGGCDGSILLDGGLPIFSAEKSALINQNSIKGFEVIDGIKAKLEKECPGVVSCADILSIVARDSVVNLGGPNWTVPLGRRDSTRPHGLKANLLALVIAGGVDILMPAFEFNGFTKEEFVALSGAHTIGMARCAIYKSRIHSGSNIDPKYAKALQEKCPSNGRDDIVAPLDTTTPMVFDNAYFTNLINKKGLLDTDQELYTGNNGTVDNIVKFYSSNQEKFFEVFSKAIVKMGKMDIITGNIGEVRTNCRKVNNATD